MAVHDEDVLVNLVHAVDENAVGQLRKHPYLLTPTQCTHDLNLGLLGLHQLIKEVHRLNVLEGLPHSAYGCATVECNP